VTKEKEKRKIKTNVIELEERRGRRRQRSHGAKKGKISQDYKLTSIAAVVYCRWLCIAEKWLKLIRNI